MKIKGLPAMKEIIIWCNACGELPDEGMTTIILDKELELHVADWNEKKQMFLSKTQALIYEDVLFWTEIKFVKKFKKKPKVSNGIH